GPLNGSTLRMYRRPLPSANSSFLTTVMWDGREPSLSHQALDATFGHAQSTTGLPNGPNAIVAFETGTYVGQSAVGAAPTFKLDNAGGLGSSDYLFTTVAPAFTPGMNDPFGASFTSTVFTIYKAWEPGGNPPLSAAAAIGRGEAIFNSRTFTVSGVNGLPTLTATCGTCHNTPNVGNHSSPLAIDIGVTAPNPPVLDVSLLPTYTFRRNGAPHDTITVTDPGRGLISGLFDDLGKTKGPVLRGLAARAPYFHNGSAPDLGAVIDFYNARFGLGLSAAERSDLIAFLGAL
ncbi:MAG: c-type cytochrome, partial [Polyangia bacterium]